MLIFGADFFSYQIADFWSVCHQLNAYLLTACHKRVIELRFRHTELIIKFVISTKLLIYLINSFVILSI